MTYIAAFRCKTGLVMCADTQETIEGHSGSAEKQYAEKLHIIEDHSYPLAFGGAGLDEPVEAVSQEIRERAAKEKPDTISDLRILVRNSVEEVYNRDVPISAWAKQYRTAEYLIAAKPTNDDFVIMRIKGRRVYQIKSCAIIGYATAPNNALLKRLHSNDLSMQQAVVLALYLVSHSKATNEGVGFDTRIAVITSTGAWLEPETDIADMESRFQEIMPPIDRLLLAATDLGITEEDFDNRIAEFRDAVGNVRFAYKEKVAEQVASGIINWPYEKLPAGSRVFQSFDDKGKRTVLIYSDPVDLSSETWALRIDKSGRITFKQTTTAYITEEVYRHLISCPSSSLRECSQSIGRDG